MLSLDMEEAAAVHSERCGGLDSRVLWVVKVIPGRGCHTERRWDGLEACDDGLGESRAERCGDCHGCGCQAVLVFGKERKNSVMLRS